jgi:signal transduction histidine kinase
MGHRIRPASSGRAAAMAIALLACAVACVLAYQIRNFSRVNRNAEQACIDSARRLREIGELRSNGKQERLEALGAPAAGNGNAGRQLSDGIAAWARQARQPGEIALATRLNRDWKEFLRRRGQLLASNLQDGSGADAAFLRAGFNLDQDLDEANRLAEADASRTLAGVAATFRQSLLRIVEWLGLAFFFTGAGVWIIQRVSILTSLQSAARQMEFAATVSHQLRTPLAVLRAASDNLADGLIDDRATLAKYCGILQHQTRNMCDLVDAVLLFASAQQDKNRYVLEPLQIAAIVEAVVSEAEGLLEKADFTLDVYIEPDLPPVIGDLAAISQCLKSLIENAIKYGGADRRIVLRASRGPVLHGRLTEVQISVADRGIGIDTSEVAHIFEPFYRSRRVRDARIDGCGLGLALASRIAQSMHATLSVVSQLAAGSTFTLHLNTAKGVGTQRAESAPGLLPLRTHEQTHSAG